MSVYGGLVPLGFTHSNSTNDLKPIYQAHAILFILPQFSKNFNPIFPLTNQNLSVILFISEYPSECLWVR